MTGALHEKPGGERYGPPESGGQHDRDEGEIVRGLVPKPHPHGVCVGTSPRATLSGRAALLTQEGVALLLETSCAKHSEGEGTLREGAFS